MTILLIATRLMPVFLVLPLQNVISLPNRIRFFIVLGLSLVLSTLTSSASLDSPMVLLFAFGYELLIGLALASIVLVFFSVSLYAGRLIDFQSGLSAASVLNPSSGSQNSLLGTLILLTGTSFFFLLDAHHVLIRGLLFSLETFPPGHGGEFDRLWKDLLLLGVPLFMYGLLIASPVVIGLLFMDVAFSATARTMPQMNPYFIALPAKIAAGVALTALSIAQFSPVFEHLFTELFTHWHKVLRG
ncbi:flagellar biosynthetic protein FliR [Parendozoicomonas haliclonae]|uniref:flagellar biosynthetic protein FliR n=1 Tax=Parendozoicomonas haliclonae TaxID=1960125 RepID=UPI0039EFA06C